MNYGSQLVLVFVGGIFIWIIAFSFLVGLVFWPWLTGLGGEVCLMYLIGMGILSAFVYGIRIYLKAAGGGKSRMRSVITGVCGGVGCGLLWPFLPFVWLCHIYDRREGERRLKKEIADFVRRFDDSAALPKIDGKTKPGKPAQKTRRRSIPSALAEFWRDLDIFHFIVVFHGG